MNTTKFYRKNDLRLALQASMQRPISDKEFARWFGYFCYFTHQPDTIRNAKKLPADVVGHLAEWLGYPLT